MFEKTSTQPSNPWSKHFPPTTFFRILSQPLIETLPSFASNLLFYRSLDPIKFWHYWHSIGCHFHQHFTCSFCSNESLKRKRDSQLDCHICIFVICMLKSSLYNVGEIDPRCQFHQHFTQSFYAVWRPNFILDVKAGIGLNTLSLI